MDVRQLKYFQRIVACGSISRAAAELRVAQPALSQHVANLESELGVRLLIRSKRGVQPTESGQRLLEHARTIVAQVDRAIEDVGSSGGTPTGEVTLGLTAGPAALLAAPLLTRARSRFPGIGVRIVDGFSGVLVEWVQTGRIDLALIFDVGEKMAVDVQPVLWEEVLLAGTGIGHEPIRPAQLARVPLILPTPAHAMRQLAERYARSNGIQLHIAYEVDALPAILALLRSGIGCSLLSQVSVREGARWHDFDCRSPEPKLERMVSLARAQGRPVTRAVEAVGELLIDIVAELVAGSTWPAKLLVPPRDDRLVHAEIETIGF
jgi:LysR family nitrogen assimilation transcriptional regulator